MAPFSMWMCRECKNLHGPGATECAACGGTKLTQIRLPKSHVDYLED